MNTEKNKILLMNFILFKPLVHNIKISLLSSYLDIITNKDMKNINSEILLNTLGIVKIENMK